MTYQLIKINDFLSLKIDDFNPIHVDFLHGALAHRKKFGGGKNQLIAKAVGLKFKQTLSVLDATAGLGRDAFVLATLGCDVTMCERSPIIQALLEDGLLRAQKEKWFQQLSLKLMKTDALDYLKSIFEKNFSHSHPHFFPDVIYLDPMFPGKTKSALVKKEMRLLRDVVGDDADAKKLFDIALQVAKKRVVIKRAKSAPTLTEQKPDIIYKGKSSRFDVYLVQPTKRDARHTTRIK